VLLNTFTGTKAWVKRSDYRTFGLSNLRTIDTEPFISTLSRTNILTLSVIRPALPVSLTDWSACLGPSGPLTGNTDLYVVLRTCNVTLNFHRRPSVRPTYVSSSQSLPIFHGRIALTNRSLCSVPCALAKWQSTRQQSSRYIGLLRRTQWAWLMLEHCGARRWRRVWKSLFASASKK